MDLYRRMAAIRSSEDADDLLDEIVDRYGEPPKAVMNLIDIALMRANAKALGITDIRQKGGEVHFTLRELKLEAIHALSLEKLYTNRLSFAPGGKEPVLRLKLLSGSDSLRQSMNFLEGYVQHCS